MCGHTNGRRGPRRRWLVLVGLTLVALMAASCAERPSSRGSGLSTTPVVTTQPTISPSAESPTPKPDKPDEQKPEPTQTESPTPADPFALADGVYPAFMRGVDVADRTVTVDVVQTFEGWKAKQAALEDGVAPWKARRLKYYPVYIRNENPLLRTLSVSPSVTIVFMGECEETTHGTAGMRELAERALPFSRDWYYSLTMRDDVIERIVQHIAIPAC